jgi:phosphonate transport system substrate-binding protein
MRTLRAALLVLTSLAAACVVSHKEERPPPPDLSPAAPGTLTVGLTAGTANTAAQADALTAFVKQATGHEARKAVFPDYDSLADQVAKGAVDVALMPPLAYVRAEATGKPEALMRVVRNGQPTYRSVIFAKAGSALKTLDDVKKGHSLRAAWVDPSSSTGYIFPKALLLTNKIDPAGVFVSQDFLGSHDSVCKAVAEDKADLGATFTDDAPGTPAVHVNGCEKALGNSPPVQVVASTENIPNDVLAVKAGFSADDKAKLVAAANDLTKSDAGKQTLKAAFNAEGFAPVSESDLDPVRNALEAFHQ